MTLSSLYASMNSFASNVEDNVRIERGKLANIDEKTYKTMSDLSWITECKNLLELSIRLIKQINPETLSLMDIKFYDLTSLEIA